MISLKYEVGTEIYFKNSDYDSVYIVLTHQYIDEHTETPFYRYIIKHKVTKHRISMVCEEDIISVAEYLKNERCRKIDLIK